MAPKKVQAERWVTGKEALEILKANSGRDDIPESYVRTLARDGKVAVMELDKRTNLYRFSDLEGYVVRRRGVKGDTRAARASGSRRKANTGGNNEEASAA